MTETVELKPCPFCGGTDLGAATNLVWCKAPDCGASGPDTGDHNHDTYGAKFAIEAWNRRTSPEGYVLVPVEPTEVHFIFPSELTNEIVDTWREVFSIIPKSEYSKAMDYAAMAYGALKRYARAKAASQQPIGG